MTRSGRTTISGRRRFLYSTNHKDIGTMYLAFAIVGGVVGGAFSVLIRMELQQPGLQLFHDAHLFNVLTTGHGLADAFLRKRRAADNPWGAGATTLEWTLPSPPTFHQYDVLPRIR